MTSYYQHTAMKRPEYDQHGNDGTFPYMCTTCGVVCETIEQLADPDHHNDPDGNGTKVPVR